MPEIDMPHYVNLAMNRANFLAARRLTIISVILAAMVLGLKLVEYVQKSELIICWPK